MDIDRAKAPPIKFKSNLFKKSLLAVSQNKQKSRYGAYNKANARSMAKSIQMEAKRDNFVSRASADREILASSNVSMPLSSSPEQAQMPLNILDK